MKRLLLIPVMILLLAALILGSCSSSTTTTTSSTQPTAPMTTSSTQPTTTTTTASMSPIKIGHIVNLTGPEAMVGQGQQKALDYAFSSINNQIAGRSVVVVTGDAGGAPAAAVDVAKKMVEQDKVVAIFGPTEIGQKMAVAGYCKQAGIPLILYNPSPLNIFNGNPWVIGSGGTTPMNPSCMGDYIYSQLGYRTIDTLTEDNSAGRAFMDPLTQIFTAEGGTVAQQQWVAEDTTDFAPYLTTLKDADALVAWEPGSAGISLLTAFHQLGIDKKMKMLGAFHGGFLDPFIPQSMAPEDAASVIGDLAPMMYAPDSQDQANQDFVQGLTAALGFPPGDDGLSGPYQAALLFQTAVNATKGDTTPDKLLAAILAANFVGPEGPESFAPGSQAAVKNVYIVKVEAVPHVPNAYHYVTVYTYKDVPITGYSGK